MTKKLKKPFFWDFYGYTKKDFKKWGKLGGRPKKYVSIAEKQKAYHRRKAQEKINTGQRVGILNMTTGRIWKK